MVKKLQKLAAKKTGRTGPGSTAKAGAATSGLLDSQLAQTVKDSAQQIWLAGLGAFAKAQGEGNKVFDTLIKEGLSLHRKTQAVAEEKIGDVAGRVTAMAGEVGTRANAHWDKLETIFEERTARALNKLGVPTAKDVAGLSERVEALAAAVAALGGTVAVKRAGTKRGAPSGKAARAKSGVRAAAAPVEPAAAPAEEAPATPAPALRKTARRRAAAPVDAVAEAAADAPAAEGAAPAPRPRGRRKPVAEA